MTDKKENILIAALELFANEGYNAVSTSKIAKRAGVSEGLIFRHFESKKGLLDAIVADAERRIQQLFAPVLFENDPRKVIREVIELPFNVKKEEYDFWRLQFKLKWEAEHHHPDKMKPLIDKLAWAFEALGWDEPRQEAELLNGIVDNISINLVQGNLGQPQAYRQFLLKKYDV